MIHGATAAPATAKSLYKIGTLEYTSRQLLAVFFWMLFGAAVMMLQSTVFNVAMPYILKDYGLEDSLIIAALSTMISLMNTVMCPVLSFRSDRCRNKLGRRRPFILYTAVPLGISMALLPFLGKITGWLQIAVPGIAALLPDGMPLIVPVAFLGVGLYFFFFLFVGAIYYYYIPDVIPVEMMGRYYGLFRVAGAGSAVFFNFFLMKSSVEQPEIVFPIIGLIYMTVASLMCIIVKEGSYPPPENNAVAPWYIRLYGACKSYVTDCFSKPYYMLYFMFTTMISISYCVGSFGNFFFQEGCGMSVAEIGQVNGIISLVTLICCLICGMAVDRVGGIVCALIGVGGMGLMNLLGGVFMMDYWSALSWKCLLAVFMALLSVASGKVLVEVFPKSKFGQFASAQAMISSLLVVILNYPIGIFADFIQNTQKAVAANKIMQPWFMTVLGDYRFINYHSALFMFLAFVLLCVFWRIHRRRTTKASEL